MERIVKVYYILNENDKNSIKEQMTQLGLTYRKMAKNLGISATFLSDLINSNRHLTSIHKKMFESQGIVFKGE